MSPAVVLRGTVTASEHSLSAGPRPPSSIVHYGVNLHPLQQNLAIQGMGVAGFAGWPGHVLAFGVLDDAALIAEAG
jgi:hypothetical protein